MKKAFSLILAFIMAACVFTAVPFTASAELAWYDGGFDLTEDEVYDDYMSVMDIDSGDDLTGLALKIPGTIDGAPVRSIANSAFYSCNMNAVVIGEGIEVIYDYAFMECPNLTAVEIEDGLTEIGEYCFAACPNLTAVLVPDSVENISGGAFEECSEDLVIYCSNDSEAYEYAHTFGYETALPEFFVLDSSEGSPLPEYEYQLCVSGNEGVYTVPFDEDGNAVFTAFNEMSFCIENVRTGVYYMAEENPDVSYQNILLPEYDLEYPVELTFGPGICSFSMYENGPDIGVYFMQDDFSLVLEDTEGNEIATFFPDDLFIDIELYSDTDVCLRLDSMNGYYYNGVAADGDTVTLSYDSGAGNEPAYFTLPAGTYSLGYETDDTGAVTFALPELYNVELGMSLSLEGDIGVNFYFKIPEDAEGTYIQYDFRDKLVEAYPEACDVDGYNYKSTFHVAAKEMTEYIHITVYSATDDMLAEDYVTVADFAQSILTAPENSLPAQEQLVQMIADMLWYGAEAQTFFGYNTDDLATAYIPEGINHGEPDLGMMYIPDYGENSDNGRKLSAYGLKYAGSTLILDSRITFRLFFTTDENFDENTVSFSCATNLTQGYRTINGTRYLYIDTLDFAVPEFDDYCFVLRIGNTETGSAESVDFYPDRYVMGEIDRNSPVAPVVSALTAFSQSSKAYFNYLDEMEGLE